MKPTRLSSLLLGNYMKLAFRHLQKHKAYCAIHIAGLAVGLTCLISIGLFVEYELRYDQFHQKKDRIFRVLRERQVPDQPPLVSITTSAPLAPTLQKDFPEIEQAVRLWEQKRLWVQHEQNGFFETIWMSDPNLFDAFTLPLRQGDAKTVLQTPTSMVISQRLVQKYFGQENPIGKTIQINGGYSTGEYQITGVMENMPHHSTLQIDMVTATQSTRAAQWWWETWLPNRSWFPTQTYVLLAEGHDPQTLERKLSAFMARYMGEEAVEKNTYFLQPLNRIYLYSFADFGTSWNWASAMPQYGNINHLILFTTIAVFVLLIACINFMNLATARAASRTREVGLRKVVGANRSQLIAQFLGESVFISFPALLCALIVVQLLLPSLTTLTGKNLSIIALLQMRPELLLVLIVLTLFVGLIAGSYPALYLSRFNPVEILKGVLGGDRGGRARKVLVICQFTASTFLIICTTIVYQQHVFMSAKAPGFDKEQQLIMPLFSHDRSSAINAETPLTRKVQTVKQAFLQHPQINQIAAFRFKPGVLGGEQRMIHTTDDTRSIPMQVQEADDGFLDVFGLQLTAGRNFSPDIESDFNSAFILNEAAAKQLGGTSPLNQELEWRERRLKGKVIGVVKDFHSRPMNEKIEPFAIVWRPFQFRNLGFKIRPEALPTILPFLEKTWNRFLPNRPFVHVFLDEDFDALYRKEMNLMQIFGLFSLLAIFVSCLGLFGLVAFMAERRTKEIGVRKVLGASTTNLTLLLSNEFTKLVAVANLVAWPLAYYAMDLWLQQYAYRIQLGLGVFVISGILALAIALGTISYQAIKAARANPIDSLRYE